MSTKVLSKSYHRTYHTCNIIKGGSGVYSRMPALTLANLYYNSQQIARCYYEHESSTHHINTLPRILFRHPTEGPSTALTLILRLLVVSINLSMNCKSNQVVRTANNGYSNSLITLQGCTSSHTLSPLIAVYSACTRQPSSGSPARVSATT